MVLLDFDSKVLDRDIKKYYNNYVINHIDASNSKSKFNDFPDTGLECMELLKAMSDKTRQEIIMLFERKKEIGVSEIAAHFTMSRPTISHHLNVMRRARLLNSRKESKEVFYSVNKEYVIRLMGSIVAMINNCC
jgi:DNA-binding transcriptional ArsR family regulator